MSLADLRRLLLLGAIWGSSYLFIRVAVPVVGPVLTVVIRMTVAGLALALYARAARIRLELRTRWPQYAALGLLNSALPFTLIGAAELRLPANLAAILIATTPLFAALAAALWLKEPLTRRKLAGMAVSLGGVAIIVGWSPLRLTLPIAASIGALLLAALFYGVGGIYARLGAKGAPPLGMAAGSQMGGAALLAFALPFTSRPVAPSGVVTLCVLALSFVCTALAYLLYYRLLADIGPTRTLTVTLLAPMFGVLWGALFLGESLTVSRIVGCVLVLSGTTLITNLDLSGMLRVKTAS